MKFQLIASAVLSAMLALSVACSGDEEAAEPTEEGGEEDGGGAGGGEEGDAAAAEGEGADAGEPAEAPPEEPAPEAAPAPEPPPVDAAPAAPAAFQGDKVVRYVTSYALNVRAEPSLTGKVLRHVKFGDKIEVIINGEWAEIGPGEYVAAGRLSETAPKSKKWSPGGAKGKKKGK